MCTKNRAALILAAVAMAIVGLTTASASADVVLSVDFNSNQDGGGESTTAGDPGLSAAAHNQAGWSSYHANHEVIAEFTTADYDGITVTPDWPNTTDNRVRQSIDRASGNDNNWDDAAGDINLVTDWIGIDTRTGNGGNGNWDGTTGTPTYMTLTLGGLGAGNYDWTSFHHDTEHCHGPFAVWLSTDGGANFTQLADGLMTDSTVGGGAPDSGAEIGGPDVFTLPSTYIMSFNASGADVVLRFAPYSNAAGVHRQIWGMNGFVLSSTSAPTATSESPANGATDVPREVVLNWTPGEFASAVDGHIVYLSDSFNDVNDRFGGITQSAASYTPAQRLELETTYYWRVDEASAPPDSTIFEGSVWSFTTEPVGYPIDGANISATASSSMGGSPPERTIDGSGLNGGDLHSINLAEMWLSAIAGPQPTWIEYQFDKAYKLHEMWVWNQNQVIEPSIGYGFKDVTIEYSVDGIDYMALGTTHEFNRAPGQPDYAHNTVIDMSGLMAKFVRLTVNTNWAVFPLQQYGLSEVRFFHIPVSAREPSPDSGATDVDVDSTLAWRAGREADRHDVYLSTDEQAVVDGTADVVTVTEPGHTPSLDLGSTYFWRIDEVNDIESPAAWQGDVWSFSTQEYIVVEDFESYNDIESGQEGSNLVYETWPDGFGIPANGSTMGYNVPFAPTMETGTVHGGKQSAPMAYNNVGAAFSEVTRTLASQNWTTNGIQTLSVWFFGDPANTPGQLYVKINGVQVLYDGDASNLTGGTWKPWNIDLTTVGTNLQSVTSLAIGVEGIGAIGTLLLDDIRLYAYPRQLITPTEPDTANLVGHWMFDESSGTTAADSSGNNNHGTVQGDAQWVAAGKVGGALAFDGVDDIVVVNQVSGLPIYNNGTDNAYSVAMWVKGGPQNDRRVFSEGSTTSNNPLLNMGTHNSASPTGQFAAYIRPDTGTTLNHPLSQTEPFDDTWHHIAWVDDNGTATLYVDGQLDGGDFNYTRGTMALNTTTIGGILRAAPSYFFTGQIDDVRIYNRALTNGEVAGLAGRVNPFDKPF